MIEVLAIEPTMAITFVRFFASLGISVNQDLALLLEASLLPILRAFVLSQNFMGHPILEPLKTILSNISHGSLSLSDVTDLIELVALTIRSTDLALDLLLDCLQPNAHRFMTADSQVVRHLLRNLIAIALEHIEEAENVAKRQQDLLDLKSYPKAKEVNVVEVEFRIDTTGTPKTSSHVRKVADDLRKYTCDAVAGQEIHSNYKAMEKAAQMIKRSDTIFTTCIGAGIGLLRSEHFDIVIVDEASQQTEPSSLVPLVKGCSKAILVGDHVQLRPTVNQTALALDFDVSLFERLYTKADVSAGEGGLKRLMLDTQYRMHPKLCEFSSREFYGGNLKSGIDSLARPLNDSRFPFPAAIASKGKGASVVVDYERAIFIDCESREMPGQKSKENRGQAELCVRICKLLASPSETIGVPHSIVVLTPYTRQAEVLKRMLSSIPHNIEISSIDGFQGREADIIVFVTVRCNEHRDIGFLKDMRRMNVALTPRHLRLRDHDKKVLMPYQ
ncbi:AAA domain-containing protein [Fusarium sp. LHS14.1]|nr:AAA domain-containing protein [Fusarium sp. LHS14.1]